MRWLSVSVSVHVNGRSKSDLRQGIKLHQERFNEDEATAVLANSDSAIDPKLSSMNVSFFKDDDRFKKIREKLAVVNEKRVASGMRKLRKDANIFMTGTVQFSDESLALLGWKSDADGKKLSADQQEPDTIERVTQAYGSAVRSVINQKDVYGDVFSATLHFDESSPHVDFMSDALDVNNIDQTARTFLNGAKGTPRGKKMREMQDKLMSRSGLKQAVIDKYDLVRGDSTAKKVDKAVQMRKSEKQLSKRETAVVEKENEIEQERTVLSYRKKNLDARETSLNARESDLNEKYDSLSEREKEIEENAIVERNRLQRIHDDLIKYADIINKTKTRVDFLKKRMTDIFMKMPLPESSKKDLISYMNGADKTVMTDSVLKTTRPSSQKIAELHDDLEF